MEEWAQKAKMIRHYMFKNSDGGGEKNKCRRSTNFNDEDSVSLNKLIEMHEKSRKMSNSHAEKILVAKHRIERAYQDRKTIHVHLYSALYTRTDLRKTKHMPKSTRKEGDAKSDTTEVPSSIVVKSKKNVMLPFCV